MDQAAAPTGERMLHRHPNSSTATLTPPAACASFHSLCHSFTPWVLDVDPGKAASPALTGARSSLAFAGERRGRSTRESPGLKLSKTTGLESMLVAMMRKFPSSAGRTGPRLWNRKPGFPWCRASLHPPYLSYWREHGWSRGSTKDLQPPLGFDVATI